MKEMSKNKLVCGVGINDVDYMVQPTVNGRRHCCPFYRSWRGMLQRCYSEKYHNRQPTYIGCTVCEEWLTFSNFKKWMETQDYENKQLDKDFLVAGNEIYSPETCVFVNHMTNSFVLDCKASRGKYPVGVHFHKKAKKYRAQCSNPFTKKREMLGLFHCPTQAHNAWKRRKHELACQLANLQTDERVAKSLRERYSPDKTTVQ